MIREEKVLHQLGFSEKESKVYLALLELGSSTVLALAKETSLKRPTVYLVLEELVRKAFVRMVEKKTTTVYVAEDPAALASRFKQNLESFQELLPRLTHQIDTNDSTATNLSELYPDTEPGETIYFSGTSVTQQKGKPVRKNVSGVLKLFQAEE